MAQRYWETVNRPNVMIKIPATQAGLPAIRKSTAAGINVNITLIFSIERYKEVMEAYLSGLEDRLKAGKPVDHIHSVASFFVSRIDSKVDKYLSQVIQTSPEHAKVAQALQGKIAVANARLAYREFRVVFESERFRSLQKQGATIQRVLWASTSTKNPEYPDTMYVDELIGNYTVNTVPPQTLEAFKDHGKVELTIEKDLDKAQKAFSELEAVGISIKKVTAELEEEGVKAFSDSYESLFATVKSRCEVAVNQLGELAEPVAVRISKFEAEQFLKRFYALDGSLWTDDPKGQEEVRIRMGWLGLPESSKALLPGLSKFTTQVKEAGYTQALLLGMGGSSLAAEVMSLIFENEAQGLKLTILDSTDPGQVLAAARGNPVPTTLYIVSSKSGGTAEVNAMFDYFWQVARRSVGERAGEHFIAITDPGTSLEKLAFEKNFRKIFLADSKVGGRYSALTAFGLVPAALMGIDIAQLLDCAAWMSSESSLSQPVGRNPGVVLGTVLGEAALLGHDKLTILSDPEIAPIGAWLEQLVAESSGKLGKGFVQVAGEPTSKPQIYGSDRLFVYFRRSGELDQKVKQLRKAGQPVLTQEFTEDYDLGAEFYKWELAVATACSVLMVNAFDQPDVQDSKNRTVEKIAYYQKHHSFIEEKRLLVGQGVEISGKLNIDGSGFETVVKKFILSGKPGDYVAINAYLARDQKNTASLRKLRQWILEHSKMATMVGFGPRFQHSTGQLHKGGYNRGLFLVITATPKKDIEIPGKGLSFGVLEYGQALGDIEALEAHGRR
ncbi:MAG: bifunctional transaldolase/phosoglucose isomerase, partial [Anaerolineae bacterium]|nr:bifunctional transaldolase/phosoglucose isomerase [Anaerolineae bacterium]